MHRRSYLLSSLVLAHGLAFATNEMPQRITGIYSNISQSQQSGDLDGMELFIIPGNEGSESSYIAFVQIADGGAPVTATVPVNITGKRIEFTLPSRGTYRSERIAGIFNGTDLVIRREDGREAHLKRGKSFWQ